MTCTLASFRIPGSGAGLSLVFVHSTTYMAPSCSIKFNHSGCSLLQHLWLFLPKSYCSRYKALLCCDEPSCTPAVFFTVGHYTKHLLIKGLTLTDITLGSRIKVVFTHVIECCCGYLFDDALPFQWAVTSVCGCLLIFVHFLLFFVLLQSLQHWRMWGCQCT